jgi:hypothetical protein
MVLQIYALFSDRFDYVDRACWNRWAASVKLITFQIALRYCGQSQAGVLGTHRSKQI